MGKAELDIVYKKIAEKIQGMENSKVLPKIIQKLLTPEQAALAKEFPGTAEELAAKIGRDLESVRKDLQYLYEIGIGTPSAKSGKWNLPRNYPMLADRVATHHVKMLPFLGPDYLDLWEKLSEERGPQFRIRDGKSIPQEPSRIIPAYKAVKNDSNLQPWENTRSILSTADKIALTHCSCAMLRRKRTFPIHTTEICLLLNRDAEYTVESGAGRYLTVDGAIKVVENCEDAGAVHTAFNMRTIVNLLCNCRPDVCVVLRALAKYGNDPQWFFPSRYCSFIDEDLCVGCGTCVDRCLFGAISIEKKVGGKAKSVLDPQRCMGCGNCVIRCPRAAIDLKCIRPEEHVPKDRELT